MKMITQMALMAEQRVKATKMREDGMFSVRTVKNELEDQQQGLKS